MYRLVSLVAAAAVVGALLVSPAVATAQSQVTLTVSVVDENDDAVGDATVTATWDDGERTVTTASNGRAFVDVPEGADVTLAIDHEDYTRNSPVLVEDATERDVTVEVALKGAGTITVVDADGEPLDNATVVLQQDGDRVVAGETDADGQFETGTVEQGLYTIRAVKPGYLRSSVSERIRADSRYNVTIERGSTRLEVTVVDDHFDPPQALEDASVRVDDADGEVARVRASGGSASISVPVNTEYAVTVSKEGYVEATHRLNVRESERAVEIATQRVPTLTIERQNERVVVGEETRLRVVNAYGEPQAGVTIRRDGEAVGETDANGDATVTIDAAGEHEFLAAGDGLESEPVVVEGVSADDGETPTQSPSGNGTDTTDGDGLTDGDAPGFGAIVAVLAILAAASIRR